MITGKCSTKLHSADKNACKVENILEVMLNDEEYYVREAAGEALAMRGTSEEYCGWQ
jgi:hypothetical protein